MALTASGNITSGTGVTLKVTISAYNGSATAEIYTSSGTGKHEKDYSVAIPAGTEYIEITVHHGGTGQSVAYEVRLDSLTAS